jgi:phage-related protein
MPSQYQISPWGATQQYQQYDVINGINIGSTTHPTSCAHYATQASLNQNPSGIFNYNITSIVSSEDVATVFFTQTGNVPSVAAGSVIMVQGTASNNYTGMAIGGQSGVLQFINPGFAATVGAAGTVSMRNPAWSTGYFFVPTYTTKFPTQNTALTTQLGDGYVQRMGRGVNTFTQAPQFVYQNIDKRQMKAIVHYVQTAAGVYPFEVLIPDAYISNQPHQKYTAEVVEAEPASYGRFNVSVQLTRAFDV